MRKRACVFNSHFLILRHRTAVGQSVEIGHVHDEDLAVPLRVGRVKDLGPVGVNAGVDVHLVKYE
jgi:hypothetical protein